MKKPILKNLQKYSFLFIIGMILYMIIEMVFRGYTFYTMGLAGGLAFVLIGMTNEVLPWKVPLWVQAFMGSFIVTLIEFIIGSILLSYNFRMWDYTNQLFNYKGIVCVPFSFLWIFLSIVAIILDDSLRYRMFNEERPRYNIGFTFNSDKILQI